MAEPRCRGAAPRRRPPRFQCHWTPAEDARLRHAWLDEGALRGLAEALGRSRRACWLRAGQLGLPYGVPQGCACIKDAAVVAGYARAKLKAILRAEGVPIRQWRGRKASAAFRFLYVELDAMHAALARYHARETLRKASARVRLAPARLRGLLECAGVVPPPRGRPGGPPIRVARADVDRVVAAYRAQTEARRVA